MFPTYCAISPPPWPSGSDQADRHTGAHSHAPAGTTSISPGTAEFLQARPIPFGIDRQEWILSFIVLGGSTDSLIRFSLAAGKLAPSAKKAPPARNRCRRSNQAFDSDSSIATAKPNLPHSSAIEGSPVGRLSAQDCRPSAALAIDPSHQRGRYCRPYRRYRLGFVKQKREEQNCAKSGN